jgi:hypothetical protein
MGQAKDRGPAPSDHPIYEEGLTVSPVCRPDARLPPRGGPRRRPWRRASVLATHLRVRRADELDASCGARLAARIHELALWDPAGCGPDWVVSDTSYMIVSFGISPQVEAYVQFLSSPLEKTVLWEVASSQYTPALEAVLTRERVEALLARGFGLGPAPSNFRREVVIDDAASARRVAAEALGILFDAFQYRGAQPLDCLVVADRRAPMALTHTRLTVRQVAFLLRRWGYSVLEVEAGSGPHHWVRVQSGSHVFDVAVTLPDAPGPYRRQLVLVAAFVPDERMGLREANAFNSQFGPARAIVMSDRGVRLELVLPLIVGLTEEHLERAVELFAQNIEMLVAIALSSGAERNLAEARPN